MNRSTGSSTDSTSGSGSGASGSVGTTISICSVILFAMAVE